MNSIGSVASFHSDLMNQNVRFGLIYIFYFSYGAMIKVKALDYFIIAIQQIQKRKMLKLLVFDLTFKEKIYLDKANFSTLAVFAFIFRCWWPKKLI